MSLQFTPKLMPRLMSPRHPYMGVNNVVYRLAIFFGMRQGARCARSIRISGAFAQIGSLKLPCKYFSDGNEQHCTD
jgi:hypothetical protein